MKFIKKPSPNRTVAEDVYRDWYLRRTVVAIVVHHWGVDGQRGDRVADWLCDPASEVSAHEVIERDTVWQIVDWEDVAWHAGSREWNAKTIGLELRPEADEETIATARARIAAIREEYGPVPLVLHEDLKATTCPGRYSKLLDKLNERPTMSTVFSSPVPVGCRYTSAFNPNRRIAGIKRPHGGADWAPPKPGQTGVPIYAAAGGTVSLSGLPAHTGKIVTVNHGVLTDKNGADTIRTNYGHLASISVKDGQRVIAGQQVGIMGKTGFVTGIHLHFGVSQWDPKSKTWLFFDPVPWLASKGITPGKTKPKLNTVTPQIAAPVPSSNPTEANLKVQDKLKAMELYTGRRDGVDGPAQKASVKAFQKAHGLVQDGKWGNKTELKYQENLKLQSALNAMRGYDIVVDGFIGSSTKARVANVKERNGWGKGTAITAAFIAQLRKVGAYK